jgi:cyclomaltodextrinase
MDMFHNSRQEDCRYPLGAVVPGTQVRLRLFVSGSVSRVTLRYWNGEEKLIQMADMGLGAFEAIIQAPDHPTLVWYDFQAEDVRGHRLYYGNARDHLGGPGSAYQDPPPAYQITVYDPKFSPPQFLREGIMYQIFPDRFYRSSMPVSERMDRVLHEDWYEEPFVNTDPRSGDNWALDFFGGDLEGIRQKLTYLKELGVTILYLNPIFKARSNHRYDTGDYMTVDPLLGDEEAFGRLCKEAIAIGIRVLLDGVFSHTGEDSLYFNRYGHYPSIGAYQSQGSPYFSWYQFYRFPDEYASWWGIPTLPEINKDDDAFRKFMLNKSGVARHWLKAGASGWRLDVADELPLNFLRDLRIATAKENKDTVLMGEVWEDASNKIAYGQMRSYALGDTLDSVMNYPLRDVLIRFLTHETDASQVVRLLRSLQENYPIPLFYSLMNLSGSHDRARILNILAKQDYQTLSNIERRGMKLDEQRKELARSRLEKLLAIIVSLPGMPSLYYGDEAGMEGASDPFCRGTYPWGREDNRTMEIVRNAFRLRHGRPVLRRGFLDISNEGDDTLIIHRYAKEGMDVFGEKLDDSPYILRITRDGRRI